MNSSYHRAASSLPATDTPDRAVRATVTAAGPSRSLLGTGLVLLAAGFFAVNGSVSKVVLESGLSSLRLVEIRCAAGAAVFALIAFARRPSSLRIGRREAAFMAVYGTVGLAMVQWLYFVAIARMPVGIALLLEFTAPLMVALWVRYARREPVRSRVWVALGLTLGGLALVAQVWAGLTLNAVGLLAGMLAAASLATYYLLGERGLGTRDPFSLAAWSFTAAAVFWALLLPWWSFPFPRLAGTAQIAGMQAPIWVLVAWVVLLGSVAPFGLALSGLRLIGAARSGLVGTAEPAIAGLVAWVVLGERLSAVQVLGAAVVLAGIVIAESARPMPPAATGPVVEGLAP